MQNIWNQICKSFHGKDANAHARKSNGKFGNSNVQWLKITLSARVQKFESFEQDTFLILSAMKSLNFGPRLKRISKLVYRIMRIIERIHSLMRSSKFSGTSLALLELSWSSHIIAPWEVNSIKYSPLIASLCGYLFDRCSLPRCWWSGNDNGTPRLKGKPEPFSKGLCNQDQFNCS